MEQPTPGRRSPSVRTIEELVREGKTLAAIGEDYGVSRQRISQILKNYGFSVEQIRPTVKRGVKCPKCQSDRTHAHGQTDAGNDRFLCLSCEKTFTIVKPKAKGKPLSNVERQRRFQAKKRLARSNQGDRATNNPD